MNGVVYVCRDKDAECGDRMDGWCLGCPKRGGLQVAVAPHAAAGPWPTAMRPATAEEHNWLHLAIRRSGTLVAKGQLTPEATIRHLMQVAHKWAGPDETDSRTDALEIELRRVFAADAAAIPPVKAQGEATGAVSERRAMHFVVDVQADNKEAAAKALHAAANSAERGVTFGVGIGHGYDYNIDRALPPVAGAAGTVGKSLQQRVEPWLMACFGAEIAGDTVERNHRFLEESLELVQACGCTASEAHQLVDYTFGRPVGEKHQEAGGVMITLAALCRAQGIDMHEQGEVELARIWTMVEKIRAKQAAKPKHSPLPALPPTPPAAGTVPIEAGGVLGGPVGAPVGVALPDGGQ